MVLLSDMNTRRRNSKQKTGSDPFLMDQHLDAGESKIKTAVIRWLENPSDGTGSRDVAETCIEESGEMTE